MLTEILDSDPAARFLFERASLTKVELDTYLIERFAQQEGIGVRRRLEMRDGGAVSKGSYMRSLKQARSRLLRALYTLLLAEYLKLTGEGTAQGLAEAGEMLLKIRGEAVEPQRIAQALSAVDSVLKRLV